jgi:uncharacterized protein (DUF983 family)
MPSRHSAEFRSPGRPAAEGPRPGRRRRLASLLHTRCPRCHRAPMFLSNPYVLWRIGRMPERCPVCGLDYEPEPGFYFGALFISYALAAPFCLLFFLLLNQAFGIGFEAALVLVALTQLAITPWLFHVSRAIWLYVHVRFDPEAAARGLN